MTSHSERSGGSSLPFAFGILFGVAATFLFGTEEGRKLVKKVVDSIPESAKQPSHTNTSLRGGTPTWQSPFTEESQHHTTYEAPPPPEPHVHPSRPEPFHPSR